MEERTIYPKILIIGQSFNDGTGGGVTLSNLFRGWNKDNLALATTGDLYNPKDFEFCNSIYLLGNKEYKIIFPFNIFQKKFASGIIKEKSINDSKLETASRQNRNLQRLLSTFLIVLRKVGFYNYIRELVPSNDFTNWVESYNPEIIYTQLGSLHIIKFINKICERKGILLITHIMDDWIMSLAGNMFYKNQIQKQIDREFSMVLKHTSLHLCISDSMAKEYSRRYGFEWHVFHNSINICNWEDLKKTYNNNPSFKILYLGRIGIANKQTVKNILKTFNLKEFINKDIIFNIFSLDHNHNFLNRDRSPHIRVYKPVAHSEIPRLLTEHDLLLLPLDFDNISKKFVRFSMPTKMPEYMASGTPILVIAPEESAIYKYSSENKVAHTCNSNHPQDIGAKILSIINNYQESYIYSYNAKKIAFEKFNISAEHYRFLSHANRIRKK